MKQTSHAEWLIARLDTDESGKLVFSRGNEASIPKYLAQILTRSTEATRAIDEVLRLVAVLYAEGATEAARLLFTKLYENPVARASLEKSGAASFKKFVTGKAGSEKAPEVDAPAPKGSLRVSDQVSALRRKVRG
ncbi:MAG: hypothetical protein HY791_26255 [Deltaproteobacteria bacterium]|nr:hypothetical protein [Deltaproteobacteria bacterium]